MEERPVHRALLTTKFGITYVQMAMPRTSGNMQVVAGYNDMGAPNGLWFSVLVKANSDKLDKIRKGLVGDAYIVKIGIMGRKAGRRPVVSHAGQGGQDQCPDPQGEGKPHQCGSVRSMSWDRPPAASRPVFEDAPLPETGGDHRGSRASAREKMAQGNMRGVLVVLGTAAENTI